MHNEPEIIIFKSSTMPEIIILYQPTLLQNSTYQLIVHTCKFKVLAPSYYIIRLSRIESNCFHPTFMGLRYYNDIVTVTNLVISSKPDTRSLIIFIIPEKIKICIKKLS